MRAERQPVDVGDSLMLNPWKTPRRSQTGLTLIELMIGMALGLIVIGATIGLALSLMRSNNDSIRAARLTQELRAMGDIVSAEVRRARSLVDPLANVGQGAAAFTTCNAISPGLPVAPETRNSSSCLVIAYQCNPSDGSGQYRMIRLASNGLVYRAHTAALTCPAGGTAATSDETQLNSAELVIDPASSSFTRLATGAIEVSLRGHMATEPGVRRTVTRVIWPRSAPVVP